MPEFSDLFSKPARARRARVLAVQVLYGVLIADSHPEDILKDFEQEFLRGKNGRKVDKKLLQQIISSWTHQREILAKDLQAFLVAPLVFQKLEVLLQAILLCGTIEIHLHITPKAVLISEYCQITQDFFSHKEGKIVQAVLNQMCTALEVKDQITSES